MNRQNKIIYLLKIFICLYTQIKIKKYQLTINHNRIYDNTKISYILNLSYILRSSNSISIITTITNRLDISSILFFYFMISIFIYTNYYTTAILKLLGISNYV